MGKYDKAQGSVCRGPGCTYWETVLLDGVRLVMLAIHGHSGKALEAHVYIEALQTPVPEAGDGILLADVAFGIMLSCK